MFDAFDASAAVCDLIQLRGCEDGMICISVCPTPILDFAGPHLSHYSNRNEVCDATRTRMSSFGFSFSRSVSAPVSLRLIGSPLDVSS